MSGHSPIPPSGASTWVKCHGSCKLQSAYPDGDSAASLEGEASHFAAAEMLRGKSIEVGSFAENGTLLDNEMLEGALLYVNNIRQIATENGLTELHIEERMTQPSIHSESFGTPDCWAYSPVTQTIYLWDYKYGHGLVEEYENWQAADYLSGILSVVTGPIEHVEFRIVQPRGFHPAGPIRLWNVDGAHLSGMFERLKHAAHAALGPDPILTSGEHCRYCSALHACPANQIAVGNMLDYACRATPETFTDKSLASELTILTRAESAIKHRKAALQEQVTSRLKAGTNMVGWCLEPASGNAKWKIPDAEIINMAALLGKDISKPQEALTPAQAKAKGLDHSVVAAFSERPSNGLKLVQHTVQNARKMFS